MSHRAWLGVVVAALVVAGTAGVVATGAVDDVLVVTAEDGERLLTTPVDDGTEVTVEYTHSVEKTLVSDVYAVRDGRLVMTRMEFSSYGAGLPSTVPVEERDGRFVYRPSDRSYATLRVATGDVAGHVLVVGGTRYDLVGLAEGGTVELRVEPRTEVLR